MSSERDQRKREREREREREGNGGKGEHGSNGEYGCKGARQKVKQHEEDEWVEVAPHMEGQWLMPPGHVGPGR